MIRLLTAGESHGKAMVGILEGFPANVIIDEEKINSELTRRQSGYGRGARQKIEKDSISILSGIRGGKTLGSPIAFMVENKDFKNWADKMAAFGKVKSENITKLRPGHADYAGMIKYHQTDIRNILERSSARSTVSYVAAGAICKQLLENFKIKFKGNVKSVGGINVNASEMNKQAKDEIDKAKQEGYSLGGIVEVAVKNLPVGLGSFTHYDRKLSAAISGAIMGIPAFKGVEFGLGFSLGDVTGHQAHDIMSIKSGKISRETNNAGGLEGGMTNGEDLIVRAVLKPLPTMTKPLPSIDYKTKKSVAAHVERADICPIEAAMVVAESMVAIEVAKYFLEKFGGDSLVEIKKNYQNNS